MFRRPMNEEICVLLGILVFLASLWTFTLAWDYTVFTPWSMRTVMYGLTAVVVSGILGILFASWCHEKPDYMKVAERLENA